METSYPLYPLSYAFVIFFLTLGPLKVIPVFHRLCYKTSGDFRQKLAQKATILSSLIIVILALIGKTILSKWDVSTASLFIAGGLLLLIAALQMLGNFSLPKPIPPETEPYGDDKIPALAINPLTIPTIITPYGVVAILVTTSQAEGHLSRQLSLLVLLLIIVFLNWLGMIYSKVIIEKINIVTLIIVGWIFAVFQSGLAIDLILEGLQRAKVFLP